MLFPYSTDAPTYHLPLGTVSIVVINIAIFVATGMGDYHDCRWLILQFDQINPQQWLTAAFMHASWLHLVGNMVFLWCFGLVVEGKLGWYRFVPMYLLIALVKGAITQIPMFLMDSEGGALGASGVIFALMAIAVIWAPENEMHCLFTFGYFFRQVDVRIVVFGAFYFALQLLQLAFVGLHMSTPMLHMLGAAVGVPVGIYMLRHDMVDCEGWDIFSRYGGSSLTLPRNPLLLIGYLLRGSRARDEANFYYNTMKYQTDQQAIRAIEANPVAFQRTKHIDRKMPVDIHQQSAALCDAIAAEQSDAAIALFRKLRRSDAPSILRTELIVSLANLLGRNRRYLDSLEPLEMLFCREARYANPARLRAAKIYLKLRHDPMRARHSIAGMQVPWSENLERERRRILEACRLASPAQPR